MYKVKVENITQLDFVLNRDDVSDIILARDSFTEPDLFKYVDIIKGSKKNVWILFERISRYEEKMNYDLRKATDEIYAIKNLDGIIIQNLDSFAYMLRKINKASNGNLKVELNYTMNCYNLETKKLYRKLYSERRENAEVCPLLFTAPVELNFYELSDVMYDTMVVYGYIDTMVTANCLRKDTIGSKCEHRFDFLNVKDYSNNILDRKNKKLYYKNYCKFCYNKIFNVEPLYLIDLCNGKNSNCDENLVNSCSLRLDFTIEDKSEMGEIFANKIPKSFTRGHFKNKIS